MAVEREWRELPFLLPCLFYYVICVFSFLREECISDLAASEWRGVPSHLMCIHSSFSFSKKGIITYLRVSSNAGDGKYGLHIKCSSRGTLGWWGSSLRLVVISLVQSTFITSFRLGVDLDSGRLSIGLFDLPWTWPCPYFTCSSHPSPLITFSTMIRHSGSWGLFLQTGCDFNPRAPYPLRYGLTLIYFIRLRLWVSFSFYSLNLCDNSNHPLPKFGALAFLSVICRIILHGYPIGVMFTEKLSIVTFNPL